MANQTRTVDAPAIGDWQAAGGKAMRPRRKLGLLPPRQVPWPLRPLASAKTSLDYDGYGRMVLRIDHQELAGITPAMLQWWFRNIGGEMEIDGIRTEKYLVWHPIDHIRWELLRNGKNGEIGPGAVFRIVEVFGGNPDYFVDIRDTVLRLDLTGFTLVNRDYGFEASRLNHDFIETPGGTLYRSTLTVGTAAPLLRSVLNPLLHRFVFTEEMGRAWLRHNVEEVGALEHILPRLYPQAKEPGADIALPQS